MIKMYWQGLIPACLGVCLFGPAMFILFKLPCKHAYQDFTTNLIESNYENCTINSLPSGLPTQVPRQIWALWDQGFKNAPRMQKTCLWSHKAANPTFNTRVLDLQSAINLTDVFNTIEKNSWDMMSIQAKSDVIRVLLLHKYGGVWADATLCMVEGLEHWLHMDVDFTTFIRHDKGATRIRPWMSSWFMVSRPGGVVITALRDAVIKFWKGSSGGCHPGSYCPYREYYWVHRLFAQVISQNRCEIRDAFDPRTAISADPFHCQGLDSPTLPGDLAMFEIKACSVGLRENYS